MLHITVSGWNPYFIKVCIVFLYRYTMIQNIGSDSCKCLLAYHFSKLSTISTIFIKLIHNLSTEYSYLFTVFINLSTKIYHLSTELSTDKTAIFPQLFIFSLSLLAMQSFFFYGNYAALNNRRIRRCCPR